MPGPCHQNVYLEQYERLIWLHRSVKPSYWNYLGSDYVNLWFYLMMEIITLGILFSEIQLVPLVVPTSDSNIVALQVDNHSI